MWLEIYKKVSLKEKENKHVSQQLLKGNPWTTDVLISAVQAKQRRGSEAVFSQSKSNTEAVEAFHHLYSQAAVTARFLWI